MELWIYAIIVLIVTWLWICLKNKFNYWSNLGVETSQFSLIWGHMKEVILLKRTFGDRFADIYKEFKSRGLKHAGSYLLCIPLYVPIDIDIVKSILQVDFRHFTNRGIYSNEKIDPLSVHLFSSEGKRWKLLRNKFSPTFTSGKIKMMFDLLLDCTEGLFKVMDLEMGNAVDIKDILGRFTIDVIGSCAFGINCNTLENPNSDFKEKGKSMFEKKLHENVKMFMLFAFPKFMKMFNARITPVDVSDFFMGVVKETVAYREKNNICRNDFLHLLIQLKNRGKIVDDDKLNDEEVPEAINTITIEEIVAQAYIFFEGGFETASTAMTFCLFELGKNKGMQDKVRGEIKRVLENHNGKFTYEAALEMTYLEQTINESLRKYPPLPGLNRICTEDYKVPGTDLVLQTGVRVIIPVLGIHRDPEFYPEPEKFDPDRFSEENKRTRPTFAFIPFGEGPRICIAARFGMMQAKVGLVALLLNYEFSVSQRTIEPLEFDPKSFIMMTKGGIWLDFKKITQNTHHIVTNLEKL